MEMLLGQPEEEFADFIILEKLHKIGSLKENLWMTENQAKTSQEKYHTYTSEYA